MGFIIKPGSMIFKMGDGTTQYLEGATLPEYYEPADANGKAVKVIHNDATFTGSIEITRHQTKRLLFAIYGIPNTNNFLKHHGGIMSRKGRAKRK